MKNIYVVCRDVEIGYEGNVPIIAFNKESLADEKAEELNFRLEKKRYRVYEISLIEEI